jgi:hypothetical protein
MHSMWMHVLYHLLLGVPVVTAYALTAAALAVAAIATLDTHVTTADR